MTVSGLKTGGERRLSCRRICRQARASFYRKVLQHNSHSRRASNGCGVYSRKEADVTAKWRPYPTTRWLGHVEVSGWNGPVAYEKGFEICYTNCYDRCWWKDWFWIFAREDARLHHSRRQQTIQGVKIGCKGRLLVKHQPPDDQRQGNRNVKHGLDQGHAPQPDRAGRIGFFHHPEIFLNALSKAQGACANYVKDEPCAIAQK